MDSVVMGGEKFHVGKIKSEIAAKKMKEHEKGSKDKDDNNKGAEPCKISENMHIAKVYGVPNQRKAPPL